MYVCASESKNICQDFIAKDNSKGQIKSTTAQELGSARGEKQTVFYEAAADVFAAVHRSFAARFSSGLPSFETKGFYVAVRPPPPLPP